MSLLRRSRNQSNRQGDRIEHVRSNSYDHVDAAILNEFPADLEFTTSSIRRGVGHDESSPAGVVECGVEDLDPEVVAVVGFRKSEWETRIVLELDLIDLVDIERRVGHDEVELADRVVRIFVVSVAFPDITAESVDSEIHLSETDGVAGFLLTIDRQLPTGILTTTLDEVRGLDKHPARAAGRVVDLAVVGLKYLDDQPDDRRGGEELATLLTFREGELAEEVLVDQPEPVTFDRRPVALRR